MTMNWPTQLHHQLVIFGDCWTAYLERERVSKRVLCRFLGTWFYSNSCTRVLPRLTYHTRFCFSCCLCTSASIFSLWLPALVCRTYWLPASMLFLALLITLASAISVSPAASPGRAQMTGSLHGEAAPGTLKTTLAAQWLSRKLQLGSQKSFCEAQLSSKEGIYPFAHLCAWMQQLQNLCTCVWMYVHFPPDQRKVKVLLGFFTFAIVNERNKALDIFFFIPTCHLFFSINIKFNVI